MQKKFRLLILLLGVLGVLVAFGLAFFRLLNAFGYPDRALSLLILFATAGIGLFRSKFQVESISNQVLAVASFAVGISLFALMFAVAGSSLALVLAIFASCFGVFRILQPTELWTRPTALASVVAAIFLIAVESPIIVSLYEIAAGWSTWIASCLLDGSAIAHLREPMSIVNLQGSIELHKPTMAWTGVLTLASLLVMIVVLRRRSLTQWLSMLLVGMMAWCLVQGVGGWWLGSASADGAEAIESVRSLGVLWGVMALLAGLTLSVMTEALTDEIPLERNDWDYPVATYFWNFLSRFPASLTNEPAGRS